MLQYRSFTVPKRPARLPLWGGGVSWPMVVISLSVLGYLTGSWVAAALVGYGLMTEVGFALRERAWARYGDACDQTFREIGEAAEELSLSLHRIAEGVEARAAAAVQVEANLMAVNVAIDDFMRSVAETECKFRH